MNTKTWIGLIAVVASGLIGYNLGRERGAASAEATKPAGSVSSGGTVVLNEKMADSATLDYATLSESIWGKYASPLSTIVCFSS